MKPGIRLSQKTILPTVLNPGGPVTTGAPWPDIAELWAVGLLGSERPHPRLHSYHTQPQTVTSKNAWGFPKP